VAVKAARSAPGGLGLAAARPSGTRQASEAVPSTGGANVRTLDAKRYEGRDVHIRERGSAAEEACKTTWREETAAGFGDPECRFPELLSLALREIRTSGSKGGGTGITGPTPISVYGVGNRRPSGRRSTDRCSRA